MKKLIFTALLAVCSIARAGYDGSGNYTLPPSLPVAGQLARAAQLNTIFNDIAAALTTAYHVAGSPNTNASLLSSGTLPVARLPAFTGDCTTVIGASLLTCTSTNGVAFVASATTDTTNASNIASGTLADARLTANIARLATSQTFTGAIGFQTGSGGLPSGSTGVYINGGNSAEIGFVNSGAAANSRLWDVFVDGSGVMHWRVINDADNSTADFLACTRSGFASATCNFPTAVTSAGVAVPKSAYAQIGGSGSCAVTGGGQGVSACSRSSAGTYSATLTGFTAAPICTASSSTSAVPIVLISPQSSTSVNVTTENISGTATDTTGIQVICSGT